MGNPLGIFGEQSRLHLCTLQQLLSSYNVTFFAIDVFLSAIKKKRKREVREDSRKANFSMNKSNRDGARKLVVVKETMLSSINLRAIEFSIIDGA